MRRFIGALACALGFVGAHAAEPAADRPSEGASRHVACLQSSVPASLAASTAGDGAARLLRARLVFKAGEAEPTVEWLWKGDDAASAQLEPSLRGYRMPCLQASEPQAVLQEFWFSPGTGQLEAGDVWPTAVPGNQGDSCYASPDDRFRSPSRVTETSKAFLYFRFPDGSEVPEVDIVHSVGSRFFPAAVREYVMRYRRCPGGRTLGSWHEQSYAFLAGERPEIKPIGLPDFLGMVRGAAGLRAHFDLNTMQCPFQVKYMVRQPAVRNSASAIGESNPHRTAFLGWLGRLQLDLPASTEAALFDEALTVNVPCLVLNLAPGG